MIDHAIGVLQESEALCRFVKLTHAWCAAVCFIVFASDQNRASPTLSHHLDYGPSWYGLASLAADIYVVCHGIASLTIA